MILLLALFATAFQIPVVTHFHDVAISPDGRRVAWTQSDTLYAGPDSPVPLGVEGPHSDSSPDWSPDSNSLVFLSDAGRKGQKQVWLYRTGTPAKLLAPLNGYADRPRWSPDGKRVAFLYVEGASGGGASRCHTCSLPRATTCSSPIPAAATAGVKRSPAPTSRTSGAATCGTS